MSSLHCSPYWYQDQNLSEASYQETKQGSWRSWKVKEVTPTSQKITLFGTMMGQLLERVATTAKQNIKMHSQQQGLFCINPTKDCHTEILNLKQTAYYKRTPQIIDEVALALLSYIEERRGTGKIVFFDLEDQATLNTNQFMFSYQAKNREIETWKGRMIVDSFIYIYDRLGLKKLNHSVCQAEDLQFLGMEERDLETFKPEKMSCFNYALLKKEESNAKAMILKHEEDSQLIPSLQEWGYRPVTHPNAGDLVLYFAASKDRAQHMGLYTEEGLVESKLGINNGNIYRHHIFDIPNNYGTSVVFMRKSQAILFE